jgi:hypothetical protein
MERKTQRNRGNPGFRLFARVALSVTARKERIIRRERERRREDLVREIDRGRGRKEAEDLFRLGPSHLYLPSTLWLAQWHVPGVTPTNFSSIFFKEEKLTGIILQNIAARHLSGHVNLSRSSDRRV